MQQRRINIRIEPSLHQFRLRHAIPAFVPHINLDCRMRRQLKLFLYLRCALALTAVGKVSTI